ncbi:energy-coupling factor ABC transporter substrate-binding protein [Companilactobacillus ginsenosidimutans]|uniref:Cobalt transport protein CbiN n=1 Tax=Companilactobacillus ginsenosidimutans TaxID=1007676 RepID=A0A0H4QD08_9LACO|nr:energy-coupling factor ABC transporter substrate-binding protein [Companilactobacillus ginsenosidimutans]AKP66219.1 cobalamin biosynthesis protein CbiN [Companilactobacillus ginsenosidimutans]
MKNKKQNIILIILVILLVTGPLIFVQSGHFGGSDDKGTEQIKKNDPSYKVWAHPLWTPPSGEIETLLFTLQGSLGTGIIAYIFGYARGKNKSQREAEQLAEEETSNHVSD